MRIRISSTPLILVLLAFPLVEAGSGPEGTVRTICLGDVVDQYGGFNSFVVMRTDPAIDTTLIPSRPDYCTPDVAMRNMRRYMPRTYDILIQDFDVIVTSDMDRSVFESRWIAWLSDSVSENGCGILWLGAIVQFGLATIDWRGTTLAEILPSGPVDIYTLYGSFRVVIEKEDEVLMEALPWERAPPLANINTQVPKEGSELWATVNHPQRYPLMTYWEIGEGAVLCFASKFPNGVQRWTRDWDHFAQAVIYLVYRTTDKDLPRDPLLHRNLLASFQSYEQMNSILVSLFSFIEMFGGRANALYETLDEIVSEKGQAEEVYLEGGFDECLNIMAEIKAKQYSVMKASFEARDSALFWVHITEWCAITGASILGGILIWALMVRRRLYREVKVTRIV